MHGGRLTTLQADVVDEVLDVSLSCKGVNALKFVTLQLGWCDTVYNDSLAKPATTSIDQKIGLTGSKLAWEDVF